MNNEEYLNDAVKGPFVLWQYYGTEGWQPQSYDTLHAAVTAQKYQSKWLVTRPVAYQVIEDCA